MRLLLATALLLLPACGPPVRHEGPSAKPHLVVFLSDDLGRLDTSIHGSPDARTPTMEKLAAAGMVFENAYVASPSCCPNRFSLLTGLMPARHGAHPNHSQVKPGTKFLPPRLGDLGYTVASFGKVGHGRVHIPGADFVSTPPRDMSVNVEKWFAEAKPEGPVCLLVGDRRPHVSWIQEPAYDPAKVTLPPGFIDTPETRDHWARYLTDITGMDGEMGRIVEIARKRLGENVLFLFTSDHGGQWPLGKWNLYDAGTRVPLVVTWPGRVAPGVRTGAMVSWVDIIPTLIDAAGGDVPDGLDGRSFLPVLLGETSAHRDRIFTTHTGDGVMNVFPIRSVREDRWKFIHNLQPDAWHTNHSDRLRKDGAGAFWDSWDAAAARDEAAAAFVRAYHARPEFELFDLDRDPHERRNLAGDPAHAGRLAAMKATLAAWTKAQGDDLQPHREPYPRDRPLPVLKEKPRKKKGSR